jgi:thioredoxin-like negative regulator of GroEL
MMALADLEANAGDAARAAELLRKVLGVDPGNAAAAYALAWALNDAGKTDEAVRVITDARASPSAARLAAALGSGDGLSWWGARQRRRLLRRSAGPLGQFGVRVIDRVYDRRYPQPTAIARGIEAESEGIARVLDAVRPLDPAAARERIEEAMREHGRQPSLLLAYAEADESADDSWHCLAMAAEAVRTSGGNADAVCALAMALYTTHDYGTALQALASLPADAQHATQVRRASGFSTAGLATLC